MSGSSLTPPFCIRRAMKRTLEVSAPGTCSCAATLSSRARARPSQLLTVGGRTGMRARWADASCVRDEERVCYAAGSAGCSDSDIVTSRFSLFSGNSSCQQQQQLLLAKICRSDGVL